MLIPECVIILYIYLILNGGGGICFLFYFLFFSDKQLSYNVILAEESFLHITYTSYAVPFILVCCASHLQRTDMNERNHQIFLVI